MADSNDLLSKISELAAEPEALGSLMKLASGMMNGDAQNKPVPSKDDGIHKDERIALICALKPFLPQEKRKRADTVIKIIELWELAEKLFGRII